MPPQTKEKVMPKVIFQPHDCNTGGFPSLIDGSIVECEVCGTHWTSVLNTSYEAVVWTRLSYLDKDGNEYNYDKRKAVNPNE